MYDYYSIMMTTYLVIAVIGLVIAIGFGFGTGKVAQKKGYSFGAFFALGFFFNLIGLIIALCISDKNGTVVQNNVSEADALLKYKDLLDAGAITEEEFTAKKAELLNGSNR